MAGKKDSFIDPATRRRNPVIRPALMCRPEVTGLNMEEKNIVKIRNVI